MATFPNVYQTSFQALVDGLMKLSDMPTAQTKGERRAKFLRYMTIISDAGSLIERCYQAGLLQALPSLKRFVDYHFGTAAHPITPKMTCYVRGPANLFFDVADHVLPTDIPDHYPPQDCNALYAMMAEKDPEAETAIRLTAYLPQLTQQQIVALRLLATIVGTAQSQAAPPDYTPASGMRLTKKMLANALYGKFKRQYPNDAHPDVVKRIMQVMDKSRSAVYGYLGAKAHAPREVTDYEGKAAGLTRRRKRGT